MMSAGRYRWPAGSTCEFELAVIVQHKYIIIIRHCASSTFAILPGALQLQPPVDTHQHAILLDAFLNSRVNTIYWPGGQQIRLSVDRTKESINDNPNTLIHVQ